MPSPTRDHHHHQANETRPCTKFSGSEGPGQCHSGRKATTKVNTTHALTSKTYHSKPPSRAGPVSRNQKRSPGKKQEWGVSRGREAGFADTKSCVPPLGHGCVSLSTRQATDGDTLRAAARSGIRAGHRGTPSRSQVGAEAQPALFSPSQAFWLRAELTWGKGTCCPFQMCMKVTPVTPPAPWRAWHKGYTGDWWP